VIQEEVVVVSELEVAPGPEVEEVVVVVMMEVVVMEEIHPHSLW